MQEKDLAEYFSPTNWTSNYDYFNQTGYALIDQIPQDMRILDVGCGYNLFKGHYGDNLWGIDPYNHYADEQISIEEYECKKPFDVALCLGSINFGDEDVILNQINKIINCLNETGVIFWRQNPGNKDRPFDGIEKIDFFPWSFEKNLEYAKKFNCKVRTLDWDGDRIYAVWRKF